MDTTRDTPSHVGTLVTDASLVILEASPRFLEEFACTLEAVRGVELTELITTFERRRLNTLDRAFSQTALTHLDIVTKLEVGAARHHVRLVLERNGETWQVFVECIDGPNNAIYELLREQQRWLAVVEGTSDGIAFLDEHRRVAFHNARFFALMEFRSDRGALLGEEDLHGRELAELLVGLPYVDFLASVERAWSEPSPQSAVLLHGRQIEVSLKPISTPTQSLAGYVLALSDVSARHQAEAEAEAEKLARHREELRHNQTIIASQRAALRALSAPRIPVTKDLMVVPFVGEFSRERMAELRHDLLEGIARAGARTVILDLTGAPNLELGAIEGLLGINRALRLIGVRGVLTGVGPNLARRLALSGLSIADLEVRVNLEDAISSLSGAT